MSALVVNVLLALVSHALADPTDMCRRKKDVEFKIYNTYTNVDVYRSSCLLEYPYTPLGNYSRRPPFSPCLPIYVRADVFDNVIYLPKTFGVKYTDGKCSDTGYGAVSWVFRDVCRAVTVAYDGLVDVWTWNNTDTYITRETKYSHFDLKLMRKVKFCDRDMWVTSQNGMLASDSKPLPHPDDSPPQVQLQSSANLALKLCRYVVQKMERMEEGYEESQKLMYLAVGGVLSSFLALTVIVCSMNCYVLGKIKRSATEPEVYVKLCNLRRRRMTDLRQPPEGGPCYRRGLETAGVEDADYVCMDTL